ncbi:MAG: hypothetical protein ACJAXJ_001595 [Colwellia sp.]|jgi:hypothetical protein
MTSPINASPLLLKPLSSQIKALGGTSLAWAKATPIEQSFSVLYHFTTDKGEKTLLTPNEFQLGLIDDVVNHHAYYLGDTGEYVLRTVNEVTKPKPERILLTQHLGFCFEEAKKTLQEMFPLRIVFRLDDPIAALNQIQTIAC